MRILVIDTETIDLKNADIYEAGLSILDTETGDIKSKDYIISDVYNSPMFKKAYFYNQNKDILEERIIQGKARVVTVSEFKEIFKEELFNNYDMFSAFNVNFDVRALSYTFSKYTHAKKPLSNHIIRKIMPVLDIAILAALVESQKPCYDCFCRKNGFTTKTGKVKTTVEAFYKYAFNTLDYSEKHNGLDDSYDEAMLLQYYFILAKNMSKVEEAVEMTQLNKKPYLLFNKK